MALVIVFTWYMNYYISMNLLNTANYITSLITSALKHEMETAVSIASFSDVAGDFNFTFLLPTSSFSTQGLAINYNITLYPKSESCMMVLMANITVTASLGPITRVMRTTTLLYSSTQPYTIIAYNCREGRQVTLANSSWICQVPSSPLPSCTWNSTDIQLGYAIISISKG